MAYSKSVRFRQTYTYVPRGGIFQKVVQSVQFSSQYRRVFRHRFDVETEFGKEISRQFVDALIQRWIVDLVNPGRKFCVNVINDFFNRVNGDFTVNDAGKVPKAISL